MARARLITIIVFILHLRASNGQQISVTTNSLGPQQTVQSNVGINTQNLNQNPDPTNLNINGQQNSKQALPSQQTINLQQLANIPMQTFNLQQPVNFQQQANPQPANLQPVNPAIHLQQVPQNFNLQQDVPINTHQNLPHPVSLQQATVVPLSSQQSLNVNAVPQSVNLQHTIPVQGLNSQQQTFAVNLQQPTQVQGVNLQQQSTVHSQQPIVVQPVNLQHQITPQVANSQRQVPSQISNSQLQTVHLANQQQAMPLPLNLQQPPTIQAVNYHQPVQHDSALNLQQSSQQCHNLQQLPLQQIDLQQQQIPCNNIEGYQVIAYQKPCQQSEVTPTLPISLQFSKVSSGPNPTVLTAVPTSVPNTNMVKQAVDNMYVVSPTNYLTTASYSPLVLTDNLQSTSSIPTIVPIVAVPNSVSSPTINYVSSNQNQHPETVDNWTSSLRIPDLGTLSAIQEQFPIATLLNQPTSSVQTALLSSILSSFQSPSLPSQYIISSSYPPQAIMNPQYNSQSSKLSLKNLLPLLLNLLQEKYTNSGCQCHCCNCECSHYCDGSHNCECSNNNILHEPQVAADSLKQVEEKTTEEVPIKDEDSKEEEEEDIPDNPRQRKKLNKYENIINTVVSKEIDDTENSSCVDENEHDGSDEESEGDSKDIE